MKSEGRRFGGRKRGRISVKVDPIDRRRRSMDGRAGILGIGVPSGPINLSSSQETGRTALPSGFKGVEGQAAKGKYRSGYPRPSVCPSVSRVSVTDRTDTSLCLSISCSTRCLDKLINADLCIYVSLFLSRIAQRSRWIFQLLSFIISNSAGIRRTGFRNSFKLSLLDPSSALSASGRRL